MAWGCSGRTNKQLVDRLVGAKLLVTGTFRCRETFLRGFRDRLRSFADRVIAAFRAVDRGEFASVESMAYVDAPHSIGFGATMSAPHMHAIAAEHLAEKLVEGSNVLDVGSGTGYWTAIAAELVGESGRAVGIDHIEGLVEASVKSVQRSHAPWLESGRLILEVGDGFAGAEKYGPFDAIHVGAAAPEVPRALIDQLKPGGWMFIPVGPDGGDQYIKLLKKSDSGEITSETLMGVQYVPLTTREKQKEFY